MDFDPESRAGNYERMWRPLERFARKYVEDADAPPILPCEFMYMGAYVDCSPIVYAYRHKGSRHYLHLTSHGNVAATEPQRQLGDLEAIRLLGARPSRTPRVRWVLGP